MNLDDISKYVWISNGIIRYDKRAIETLGSHLQLFLSCAVDNIVDTEDGETIDYEQTIKDFNEAKDKRDGTIYKAS